MSESRELSSQRSMSLPKAAAPSHALILGASGALGGAIVEAFLRKGSGVVGTGFRRTHSKIPSFQLDATSEKEVLQLGEWMDREMMRIDVAVHCIGSVRDSVLSRLSDPEFNGVLDVNLKSAFLISKMLLSRWIKQRSGHLILVSSWAGVAGRAGQANYAASKAGLIALTQSIAREYASRGILANCIVPGVFRSPLTEALAPKALERLWEDAPLRRYADLDETADFIVHLSGMRGVTGQVFHLDGRIAPHLR